jgi:hypothetical protein
VAIARRRAEAEMADRPLSGDLEAARRFLFEDALGMEAEQASMETGRGL